MQQNTASGGTSTFTAWQLTLLVITAGMVGMYFYPPDFTRTAPALFVMTAALVLISMAMLAYCFRHSQATSFPSLLSETFGRIAARIILAAAAVYFAFEAAGAAVRHTRMTGLFLLEKTPSQVIAAVTLITACFIIYSGIRQVARTAELLFFAVMLPLVLILILALLSMDFGELAPLVRPIPFSPQQAESSVLPLSGIAAVAYFAGYYDKKKLRRSLLGGTTLLAIFCLLVMLCCVGVFSVEGTRHLSFPLTELSRIVSTGKITFTQRFDILYMMVYTAVTVLTDGILTYCCCISLCGTFGIKNHRCFIFIVLPVVFAMTFFGLSNVSLMEVVTMWGKILFLFVLIPTVFMVSAVKNIRRSAA